MAWTIATEITEREAELGEVEGKLDRALAPVEEEREARADEAGDDERRRRDEEEARDERQLAHRERVRAPPDVEVDDLGLGQVEAAASSQTGIGKGHGDGWLGRDDEQGRDRPSGP